MKKLIVLFIGICLVPINCLGQNNKESASNKKLDQKIIEIFKKEGKYKKIINDTLFTLTETKSNYTYIAKPVNENFRKISIYYKKTLTLSYECQNFIRMRIGLEKKYDENGNLIREANFDEGFENFTVNDFIITVKKELKIDLNKDIKELGVSRTVTKIPEYHITIFNKKLNTVRVITISGITKKVTSDKTEDMNASE
jgi:hypothetical protein